MLISSYTERSCLAWRLRTLGGGRTSITFLPAQHASPGSHDYHTSFGRDRTSIHEDVETERNRCWTCCAPQIEESSKKGHRSTTFACLQELKAHFVWDKFCTVLVRTEDCIVVPTIVVPSTTSSSPSAAVTSSSGLYCVPPSPVTPMLPTPEATGLAISYAHFTCHTCALSAWRFCHISFHIRLCPCWTSLQVLGIWVLDFEGVARQERSKIDLFTDRNCNAYGCKARKHK